ncbi:AAA family ATPase [Leptothoe sp. LEGE 181152]|nr:AAA family ATPase [Leptothoe sp. LEGE 181152]
MYIRSFKVTKLNQQLSYNLIFNDDLNILTGRNGSGKTTLLKLMWCLISGNIELAIQEVDFESAEVITDSFCLRIYFEANNKGKLERFIQFLPHASNSEDSEKIKLSKKTTHLPEQLIGRNLLEINQLVASSMGKTIFFPTFRRVEGGFSVDPTSFPLDLSVKRRSIKHRRVDRIYASFNELSERLSDENHRFVCSISTEDIVRLITTKYADASETINERYRELSGNIIKVIDDYKGSEDRDKHENSSQILNEIQSNVSEVKSYQENTLKPFSVLSELVFDMFQHEGIKISESITLGNRENQVDSSQLSAGEKQMLSFLCYNSFVLGCPIFIDEPELSLHVDWQRLLFPTLLDQNTKNQFIVATHSPFIYSKYEDKEIILNPERGDTGGF